MDDVDLEKAPAFIKGLKEKVNSSHSDLCKKIEARAKLEEVEAEVKAAIEDFKKGFSVNG